MAVILNHPELIEILLQYKARINMEDQYKNTVLHYGVSIGDLDLLTDLLTRGAQLHYKNSAGLEPLHVSVMNDDVKTFNYLLDKAGSTQHQSEVILRKTGEGKNCIHYAVQFNAIEIFRTMVKLTRLLDERDNEHRTPLMLAVMWDRSKFVEEFIRNGADLLLVDLNSNNLLMFAAKRNNLSMFNLLLKKVDLDNILQRNDKGDNLLHIAAVARAYEVFKKVLDLDIDKYAKNKGGVMPIDLIMSDPHLKHLYDNNLEKQEIRARLDK
jgi:ankyrin repeat protein